MKANRLPGSDIIRWRPVLRFLRQSLTDAALPLALLAFLSLSLYQLSLPGLHYDEVKEAGLNALQLLRGLPVEAFRGAGVRVGGLFLPLMVQEYIGALNVYLALPFIAALGPTAGALRLLPILTGAFTLVLVYLLALELARPRRGPAAATVLLLAVNPSFIFWSRQGIFVTNIGAFLFVASLLAACRWWRIRQPAALYALALIWGLGLWVKLLFVWAVGAMAAWGLIALVSRRKQAGVGLRQGAVALGFFLAGALPLLLFNLRTGGTMASVLNNLGTSYYGVRNAAFAANLAERLRQVVTLLRGDHFWYLGGTAANLSAPWLAGGLVAAAAVVALFRILSPHPPPTPSLSPASGTLRGPLWEREGEAPWVYPGPRGGARAGSPYGAKGEGEGPASTLLPLLGILLILTLIVAQSSFTVSGLFITHYALLLPLAPLAAALAADVLWRNGGRVLGIATVVALLAWGWGDLRATIAYHQALARTGGHSAHSDAMYALARYLDEHNYSAPFALDWGINAPVTYLTAGRVHPVEVFGYERLDAPDDAFAARLRPFLDNPHNVYLLHAPEDTIFRGRREALERLASEIGASVQAEQVLAERSGRPLFIVARVEGRR
ncbi:MAG: hypothetical protein IT330_02285 [Anaerolineae bacterium]|nr:hypothetical protein [Anaerolineae bacterium]